MQAIRDIRGDLKARLDLVGDRRQKAKERYEAELNEIKNDEKMLEALLASEQRLMATSRVTIERQWAGNPLENEILDLLSDEKLWEHGDIKSALLERGIGKDDDPKHFGQSLHGTLLSMSRRDLLESGGYGKWKITKYGLTGRVQLKEEQE
ncbi:MAG: hypothetical protein ABSE67_01995 [Xanthobacteraceae bacterium]